MKATHTLFKPYPPGAHYEEGGIRFTFASDKDCCGIIIYDKKTKYKLEEIPFSSEERLGNLHSAFVTGYQPSDILYQFYEGTEPVPDRYGVWFADRGAYGMQESGGGMKAGFITSEFDWEYDKNPHIPYEDSLIYLMHVRGFTQHPSSGVEHKGTFRGILEKIPYLREIGVNCVVLQPAYEFLETALPKLNYWGYQSGFYYAPKAAYAAGDAVTEMKELVRALHKSDIELVLQFYFPKEVSAMEIPDILRYWVMEYHVDGFQLIGERLPADAIAADPALANTKLWYESFDADARANRDGAGKAGRLALCGDDYLCTMRRFLKGDEEMVQKAMLEMRHIPKKIRRIHYMSNYCGMTLMDMVSYDRKHNEANGEDNRDGTDYNYSWNCGEEGDSSRKKVLALRVRQVKNALCMLMFSQSAPMIFMGDEFGNSQKGNNNPYCQDNEIAWLDWEDRNRNRELFDFWKRLVEIRQTHLVLHQEKEPQLRDYIACGFPDLSYHGKEAWAPETTNYSRSFAMMYCEKFVPSNSRETGFLYLTMNMHWEKHEFAFPRVPAGLRWEVLVSTASGEIVTKTSVEVPARSIVLLYSVPEN